MVAEPAAWALDVCTRDPRLDPRRRDLCRVLADLALPTGVAAHHRLYVVAAPPVPALAAAVERLCVDPLLATVRLDAGHGDGTALGAGTGPGAGAALDTDALPNAGVAWVVDVFPRPGVTDAEADSLAVALAADGWPGVWVRTGHRYLVAPDLSTDQAAAVARALAHPVVEAAVAYPASRPPVDRWTRHFAPPADRSGEVETVGVRGLDDAALAALSAARLLALSLADLRAVRDHFAVLGRDPTDVELETIAQTWSEHCAHRTFKATIRHREPGRAEEVIPGLLKTFIVAATAVAARPWVRSAFVDNAGVVAFDRGWELSFKVETHNHPSAIEPFGGANTGVGGVVRDLLGVSAEPIANTDVLCFGPPDMAADELPSGTIPPARLADGVVAGIADYGNKMGIPTVNGAVVFDPGYAANPLVFCGTVGLAPAGARPTQPSAGDLIVMAGGRVGRDGIHGATFSSEVLDAGATADLGSVVQIGDPIVEKRLADALPRARDRGLYSAITDCGAGGLSSAVGEMARHLGADVELERVPLKYPGLRPWEVWLSEAQERMVLAVPPDRWEELQAVFAAEGVEATAIGAFTGDGRLRVRHACRLVADLDGAFLHDGMPTRELISEWAPPGAAEPPEPDVGAARSTPGTLTTPVSGGLAGASPGGLASAPPGAPPGTPARTVPTAARPGSTPARSHDTHDLGCLLERMLADPNVASKEAIVRQYDHEVQGRTIGKPFVGPDDLGPADAAVLRPVATSRRGVAVGCGINPRLGMLDPYAMALHAVDEALRNVVAVGADPDRTALLDNFCWGNPNLPDRLGGLVRAARGCHDAAVGYRAPFVSGKDSLFNEYRDAAGRSHAIPGTLLISALGIVPDLSRTASMDLKEAGNLLYLVGATGDELGGSLLLALYGETGGVVPPVRPQSARSILRAMHRAIRGGLVRACHDLSEGGLAVAAAEMAIAAGGLGVDMDLGRVAVKAPSPTPPPRAGEGLSRTVVSGTEVPRFPTTTQAAAPLPREGEGVGGEGFPADTALLFAESPTRFLVEVAPIDAAAFERVLGRRPHAAIGRVLDEARLRVQGTDGTPVIDADVAALRRVWRAPLAPGVWA